MALAYTATARLTDPHQELRVDGLNFQTLEWTRRGKQDNFKVIDVFSFRLNVSNSSTMGEVKSGQVLRGVAWLDRYARVSNILMRRRPCFSGSM